MAEIFPLRPSEHDAVQQLLPWHVNGTLTAEETARVEAHLAQCDECRDDLAGERDLAREIALLPLDVDEGWQAMALRVGAAPAGNDNGRVPLLRRQVPAGWAVGGAIAASLVLTVAATSLQRPAESGQTFHTLGSPAADATGQVVVLFRPDTTEQQMSTILAARRARLVDGPTAAGAYVLRLEGGDVTEAIDALRRSNHVVLAEPIASDDRP
jgi:anti-sigma factor RsiW